MGRVRGRVGCQPVKPAAGRTNQWDPSCESQSKPGIKMVYPEPRFKNSEGGYPPYLWQGDCPFLNKWVWLKITQEGLRRFPLRRVPFWYRFLEQQIHGIRRVTTARPAGALQLLLPIQHFHRALGGTQDRDAVLRSCGLQKEGERLRFRSFGGLSQSRCLLGLSNQAETEPFLTNQQSLNQPQSIPKPALSHS